MNEKSRQNPLLLQKDLELEKLSQNPPFKDQQLAQEEDLIGEVEINQLLVEEPNTQQNTGIDTKVKNGIRSEQQKSACYQKLNLLEFQGDMNLLGLGNTFQNRLKWKSKKAAIFMSLFFISTAFIFFIDLTKLGEFISVQDKLSIPLDDSVDYNIKDLSKTLIIKMYIQNRIDQTFLNKTALQKICTQFNEQYHYFYLDDYQLNCKIIENGIYVDYLVFTLPNKILNITKIKQGDFTGIALQPNQILLQNTIVSFSILSLNVQTGASTIIFAKYLKFLNYSGIKPTNVLSENFLFAQFIQIQRIGNQHSDFAKNYKQLLLGTQSNSIILSFTQNAPIQKLQDKNIYIDMPTIIGLTISIVFETEIILVKEYKYYSLQNWISDFGGGFTLLKTVFILIPVSYFLPSYFSAFIVSFIYQQKKQNNELDPNLNGQEQTDAIKSNFLKRLSHIGLYHLYDKVEEQQKIIEKQEKKIEEQDKKIEEIMKIIKKEN